jgi:hypothetical protein
MQDRFAGDIGDFGKYGLLRALARPPLRLGIIWYRTPNGNSGGSRTDYLRKPERYRMCDPVLFDALVKIPERSISLIAFSGILPWNTLYADEPVSGPSSRDAWLRDALDQTTPCDLMFLDPDNGLAPRSIPRSRSASRHYAYPEEIAAIRKKGQSMLIYHHFSRRETLDVQLNRWLHYLGDGALALRFHRGGSRAFFLRPAPAHQTLLIDRVQAFLETPWSMHFTCIQ